MKVIIIVIWKLSVFFVFFFMFFFFWWWIFLIYLNRPVFVMAGSSEILVFAYTITALFLWHSPLSHRWIMPYKYRFEACMFEWRKTSINCSCIHADQAECYIAFIGCLKYRTQNRLDFSMFISVAVCAFCKSAKHPTSFALFVLYLVPVSILRKSISGRHRPVRVADGPMTARCRFT